LASAMGTLVASLAALVALSVFVLDARPAVTCVLAIGLAWLAGLTMQLIAGSIGRMDRSAPVIPARPLWDGVISPPVLQNDDDSHSPRQRDKAHERIAPQGGRPIMSAPAMDAKWRFK
jgi:hypothetical protein